VLALCAARGRGPGRTTSTSTDARFGPQVAQLLETLGRSLAADEYSDFIQLLDGFNALDRRRRRLLVTLLQELGAARRLETGL
jgi:hypothetical protein